MNIFITGATGVIGCRLVPLLVAAGYDVSAVVRSERKGLAIENAGARMLQVDLFDRQALRNAVAGHDTIINLATHIPRNLRMLLPGAWRENDRIRKFMSANLVDAAIAAGARRFIQESFAPVYPDRGNAWIEENTPIAPTRYNRTVADAEASARRFSGGGKTGVVLRFAAFYGPDAFQVRDMIKAVRKGWAPLPGPPGAYVSSISHDDAASAVVAALRVPAGTYNVTDDEPLRRRDYADVLAAALGVAPPKPLPAWVTALTGSLGELMSRSLRISNRLLRLESSWQPKYPSLREGWPATLAALRDNNAATNLESVAAMAARAATLSETSPRQPCSGMARILNPHGGGGC